MKQKKKKRKMIIVNSPLFIIQHLLPIINLLKKKYEIYLIYKYNEKYRIKVKNVKSIFIPLNRNPSIFDLISFIQLIFIKISIKPNISISFTPKGGLLNILTNFINKNSFHYFTGQRWVKFKGLKLKFYKLIDKFIIIFSDRVFCDSNSQAEFISSSLKTKKPFVIGKGSISGVAIKKYNLNKEDAIKRLIKKEKLISKSIKHLLTGKENFKYTLFGFVGRLNIDKGIDELLRAFYLHNKKYKNSYLILIGPNELDKNIYGKISELKNCFHIQFMREIET